MNKRWISLIAVALCAMMMLTFASCGERLNEAAQVTDAVKTEPTAEKQSVVTAHQPQHLGLVGDWTGTFDKTVQYTRVFGFEINAVMSVEITFQNDGYCMAKYNQAELYNNVMASVMTHCETQGITLDEFYAGVGHDAESFRTSFVQNGDIYEEKQIYDFTGDQLIWYGAANDCVYTEDSLTYSLMGGLGTVSLNRVAA